MGILIIEIIDEVIMKATLLSLGARVSFKLNQFHEAFYKNNLFNVNAKPNVPYSSVPNKRSGWNSSQNTKKESKVKICSFIQNNGMCKTLYFLFELYLVMILLRLNHRFALKILTNIFKNSLKKSEKQISVRPE